MGWKSWQGDRDYSNHPKGLFHNVRWPIGKRLLDSIVSTANREHIFENIIQRASRPPGLHFILWAFETEWVSLVERHTGLFFSRFLRWSFPQPWPSQPLTFPQHHYCPHYIGKYRDFMIIREKREGNIEVTVKSNCLSTQGHQRAEIYFLN